MTNPSWRTRLRRDLIIVDREDGGVDLLDVMRDKLIELDVDAVLSLDGGDPSALASLDAEQALEGPGVDAMRDNAYLARKHQDARPTAAATLEDPVDIDWTLARRWPDIVADPWRDPERLRRLAHARAAGQRYMVLEGFLRPDAARAIAERVRALPFERWSIQLLSADRHLTTDEDLPVWRDLLRDPDARVLFGALIGRTLPAGLTVNAWRLAPGDMFGVHPDGRRYFGTISLGLCEGWKASDGGAIAFGDPGPGGLVVRQRWLPHLGDVCLFAPDDDTWHMVEPVTRRPRHTVTGWWVEPSEAL